MILVKYLNSFVEENDIEGFAIYDSEESFKEDVGEDVQFMNFSIHDISQQDAEVIEKHLGKKFSFPF